MRAMLCHGFEGIASLRFGETAEPIPAPDEVAVDVHAASVSYMDYLMVSGGYQLRPPLPYVPGTDAVGIVAAVGEKVTRFGPGDRVACANWYGGFAERMTAKASRTVRLPDNLDFAAGSTVLHVYLTAWYALVERAQLRPGEIVLVTGAAGGVGLGCVELAHAMGPGLLRRSARPRKPTSSAVTVLTTSSTTHQRIFASVSSRSPRARVSTCAWRMSAASSLRRSPGSCDGTGGSCRSVLPAAKSRPF